MSRLGGPYGFVTIHKGFVSICSKHGECLLPYHYWIEAGGLVVLRVLGGEDSGRHDALPDGWLCGSLWDRFRHLESAILDPLEKYGMHIRG